MATDRTANVVWQGDLMNGSGTIEQPTSTAFGPLDVSWASRADEPNGKTSPEELIAAAWASCFAMALSAGLAKDGNPPEKLETSATVTFQPGEGISKGRYRARHRARPRRRRLRGCGAGREGELPRLEGARRHSRRDARRPARVALSTHGRARRSRRRARPLLRGGAGAALGPCGLQRPPRGCGRRAPPEGARRPLEARAAVEAGARGSRGLAQRRRARGDVRRLRGRRRAARGGAEARTRRARPGRREGRDRRDPSAAKAATRASSGRAISRSSCSATPSGAGSHGRRSR